MGSSESKIKMGTMNDIKWPQPISFPEDLDHDNVPLHLTCPLTFTLMTQPAICPSGITYDKQAITKWLKKNNSDPFTREHVRMDLYPNRTIRELIIQHIDSELSC